MPYAIGQDRPDSRNHVTYVCGGDDNHGCNRWFTQEDLYQNHYIDQCVSCGRLMCPIVFHECEEDYDEDEYESEGPGIYGYSYVPPLTHYGAGAYFLGIELEVSARDAGPIYEWCRDNGHRNLMWCKQDSSVNGFEIVTHPMSPDYFRGVDWESFFAMLNESAPHPNNLGLNYEPSGHGLHVHVSDTAFSPTTDQTYSRVVGYSQLARWSYLLNRHSDHVQRIARRNPAQWGAISDQPVRDVVAKYGLPYWVNRWQQLPAMPDGHELVRRHVCTCGGHETNPIDCVWSMVQDTCACGDPYCTQLHRWQRLTVGGRQWPRQPGRYSAINMGTHHSTHEVRVFRSTRNANVFRNSVGLVTASVDYVRSMQRWHATTESVSWGRFVEWARETDTYGRLADVLAGTADIYTNTMQA